MADKAKARYMGLGQYISWTVVWTMEGHGRNSPVGSSLVWLILLCLFRNTIHDQFQDEGYRLTLAGLDTIISDAMAKHLYWLYLAVGFAQFRCSASMDDMAT